MRNINYLLSFVKKSIEDTDSIVKNSLYSDNFQFIQRNEFIKLKQYADNFLNGTESDNFVHISGFRGVGKTTVMFQLYNDLLKRNISPEKILYFSANTFNHILNNDLEDVVNVFLNEFPKLSDDKIFILIDDVQEFSNWFYQACNIKNISENIFLVCAGSFSQDSSDDAIFNNYFKKEFMFPLSFYDYLKLNFDMDINNSLPFNLRNSIFHGDISSIKSLENSFYKSFKNRDVFLNSNWMYYLLHGSFPANLYFNEFEAYNNTNEIINNVIEKDIFNQVSFNIETKSKIFKLVSFIAFSQSNLSKANLAKFVKLSYSRIQTILQILEKNRILFHINSFDSKGESIKKLSKYYFISPNLKVALNNELGNYNSDNDDYMLNLTESLVASILYKMQVLYKNPLEIYFPKNKKQADFLIKTDEDKLIPIEVGFGDEPKRYVFNSIDEFDCEYGIVVCDAVSFTKKINNVIYMPLTSFSLI